MSTTTETKIEWAHWTFNPWRGCTHATLADGSAHPGCEHCYAEAMSKRNPGTLGEWGEGGTRVVAAEYAGGGYTMERLGEIFGVRFQHISRIVRGQRRPKQGGPVAGCDLRVKAAAGRELDGRTWDEFPEVAHA